MTDLDLAYLLDSGHLVQLGSCREPGGSPSGYYASVRRMGDLASVSVTGETPAEALARARELAERKA